METQCLAFHGFLMLPESPGFSSSLYLADTLLPLAEANQKSQRCLFSSRSMMQSHVQGPHHQAGMASRGLKASFSPG